MIYGVYAIRDSLTGFLTPTVDVNDPAAVRNFTSAVLTPGALFDTAAKDYDFFRIGDFDSDTGQLIPLFPPQHLANGLSVQLSGMVNKPSNNAPGGEVK